MRKLKYFVRRSVGVTSASLMLFAVVASISGCGGGGDNGGSNGGSGFGGNGSSSVIVSGTIQPPTNMPASGWAVGFDVAQTSQYETTTGSSGQYSITIPISAVTGHDTLAVADTTGNVWCYASLSVSNSNVTQNITLPAYDTITGSIDQSTGGAAVNYEFRFVTADTSVTTGLYWSAFTDNSGNFTLDIPVTIMYGSGSIPVVTGSDNIYINSYPSQNTLDDWYASSIALSTTGGTSYTLSPDPITLPASPISTQAATAHAHLKFKTHSTHGIAIEKPNRALPQAEFIRVH